MALVKLTIKPLDLGPTGHVMPCSWLTTMLMTHLLGRLWGKPLYPPNCAMELDISPGCSRSTTNVSPPGTPFLSRHFPGPWWWVQARRKDNELWSQAHMSPWEKTLVRSESQTWVLLYDWFQSLLYLPPHGDAENVSKTSHLVRYSTKWGNWSRHVSDTMQCSSLF